MYVLNGSQEDRPKDSHTLYRTPFKSIYQQMDQTVKKIYALFYIVIFKVTHYILDESSLKTANALESLRNYL